jgi:hypothetical protein
MKHLDISTHAVLLPLSLKSFADLNHPKSAVSAYATIAAKIAVQAPTDNEHLFFLLMPLPSTFRTLA